MDDQEAEMACSATEEFHEVEPPSEQLTILRELQKSVVTIPLMEQALNAMVGRVTQYCDSKHDALRQELMERIDGVLAKVELLSGGGSRLSSAGSNGKRRLVDCDGSTSTGSILSESDSHGAKANRIWFLGFPRELTVP